MPDWQESWPEARPRWGTYSVKAHQELDRLIPDLLMYDVLVFPSPDTDEEWDRWVRNAWEPELLAMRVNQLGDHAVVCPWDPGLRSGWETRWWALPAEVRKNPEAAFTTTAVMIAEQSLVTLMGEEDDRFGQAVVEQPRVHPAFEGSEAWTRRRTEPLELVSAFQTDTDAAALTGSGGRPDAGTRAYFAGQDQTGFRLRLELATPEAADDDTLRRTLDLIEDEDFQQARRRFWSWEETLRGPDTLDPRELVAGLDALVADYNRAVRRERWSSAITTVFLIVPTMTGLAIDAMTGGLTAAAASVGTSVVFDKVKARFPRLEGKATRASHHPGSAVAGMLAIAGVARPS
jgi:hypothetical protein